MNVTSPHALADVAGFQPLTPAEASVVSGGARIRIPVGYDAAGNVMYDWVEVP